MANVIQQVKRPTLILSHNKTPGSPAVQRIQELLPRQLRTILRQLLRLLPQPEAYIPSVDKYIEKRPHDKRWDRQAAAGHHISAALRTPGCHCSILSIVCLYAASGQPGRLPRKRHHDKGRTEKLRATSSCRASFSIGTLFPERYRTPHEAHSESRATPSTYAWPTKK